MRIYNRPFDEQANDFKKMWDFLIDDYTDKKDQFIWSIGRLGDWKYGMWNEKKYFPSFMRKNAQLWFNGFDELVGFVISEDCESSFTVFARKGYEFLYQEQLTWIKANWSDREGDLCTEVHEYQPQFIQELEKAGFKQTGLACVTRQYLVNDKSRESADLDPRYIALDMLAQPDLKGKAMLYINAWNSRDTLTDFDLQKYEYNRESPCFHPKFDLSIVDESGAHVSACVAFIDYKNSYAEIEKVCTHNNHRGKGLAEAVIRECFKRLHAEGIQHAYITGYSEVAKNLYGKLGAVKSRNWYNYTLSKD